jgi:hypothetical protein
MGNLVSSVAKAGAANKTLYKYHVSKTNRIVSTDESGGEDEAADERASHSDTDDDDEPTDNNDSERNTNRINSEPFFKQIHDDSQEIRNNAIYIIIDVFSRFFSNFETIDVYGYLKEQLEHILP